MLPRTIAAMEEKVRSVPGFDTTHGFFSEELKAADLESVAPVSRFLVCGDIG